ncbi:MAG TPA: hypothetical protein VKB79_17800 [Bryobacteraceae bacterium]|nr:hypothetical protein [Bryobacteraceae bacterium]
MKQTGDSRGPQFWKFLEKQFRKISKRFGHVILRYVPPEPGDEGDEHGWRLYLPFGKNREIVEPSVLAAIRLLLGEECPHDAQAIYLAWARVTAEKLTDHSMIAEFAGIEISEVNENAESAIQRFALNRDFPVLQDSESYCQAMRGPDLLQAPEPVQIRKQAMFPAEKWEDITMVFFNEHTVRIAIAGRPPVNADYAVLGMADQRKRNRNLPAGVWKTLLAFARQGGRFPAEDKRPRTVQRRGRAPAGIIDSEAKETIRKYRELRAAVRKNMQTLRKRLRELFGLHTNPIQFNRKTNCYEAAFWIVLGADYPRE